MTRIYINKKYFDKLLYRRYAKYITDERITKRRLLLMLSGEVNCSVRSLYNFMNNTYSLELLANIVQALNITEEEFNKLMILKDDNQKEL